MENEKKQLKLDGFLDSYSKSNPNYSKLLPKVRMISREDEMVYSKGKPFLLFSYCRYIIEDPEEEDQSLNNENQQKDESAKIRPHMRLINN